MAEDDISDTSGPGNDSIEELADDPAEESAPATDAPAQARVEDQAGQKASKETHTAGKPARNFAVSPQKSAGSSTSILPLPPEPYNPNGLRGGRFGTGKPKSDVDWSIYRAAQVPGPGHYGAPRLPSTTGGRFSSASPKSDVEWEMLRASKIPAPGQYKVKEHIPPGGRFSSACPKSDLEWKMLRASQVPGPGQYPLHRQDHMPGGRMSTSAIVTDVDWTMRRSAKIPGPGAYDFSYGSQTPGGRFSTSKPKTEVEWLMHRARQIPGPGEYRRPLSMPTGGRFGESKPKTALEQIMHRSAKVPGPGNYDVDIYSIGRRSGAVSALSSSTSSSKPSTPHSAGIPPEARRKPKPKSTTPLNESSGGPPSGPRPHTSLGVVEGDVSKTISAESSLKRDHVKSPSAWYKRGVSREGSGLRTPTPGAWLLPESAQRAYGVWKIDSLSTKKPKSRKTADKIAKPLVIKVHVDSGNPSVGNYEMEIFEDAPAGAKGLSADDEEVASRQQVNTIRREELSENAKKLFDLAMDSDEFRRMMQLYTGMEDPTSVIQNYAEMWAKQPLCDSAKSGRQNRRTTAKKSEKRGTAAGPATR